MKLSMLRNLAVVGMGTALLAACDHNDNNRNTPEPEPEPVMLTYEVTIENISAAQPLSPVAVLLHGEQSLWQVGESASAALEVLAEGGDNSDVLVTEGTLATESGSAPVGPGSNESYQLTVSDEQAAYLSVVTMLVNTNDAFTGITNKALSEMAVNDSMAMMLPVYDAGTEANSEAAGTIPGPADGGEGFNAERDDADSVSYHPGVVSSQDTLPDSVLMAEHRFDNPVARLIITRVE